MLTKENKILLSMGPMQCMERVSCLTVGSNTRSLKHALS